MTKISNQYSLTNVLFADAVNGRVGIGTASPAYLLDVSGDSRLLVAANGTRNLFFGTSATNYGKITYNDTSGELSLGTTQSYSTVFLTNNTEKMRITSGGNVGIGTTSPAQILHVASSAPRIQIEATTNSNNGGLQYKTKNSSGTIQSGGIYYIPGTTPYLSLTGDDNNGHLNITSSGNVGIGTSTPDYRLRIETSSADVFLTKNTSSTSFNRSYFYNNNNTGVQMLSFGSSYAFGTEYAVGAGGFVMQSNTTSAFAIGTSTATPLIFGSNTTERMRIFASGNVRFSSQVYGNTVSSPRTLFIAADGELGGISSIRESKTNINSIDSNWLMQLNPVSFNYRKKDEDGKYTNEHYSELFYGLIAEETEIVNKEICTYNEDKLVGIEYSKLVPVLVKAIQELSAQVSEQQTQINELKALLNA